MVSIQFVLNIHLIIFLVVNKVPCVMLTAHLQCASVIYSPRKNQSQIKLDNCSFTPVLFEIHQVLSVLV